MSNSIQAAILRRERQLSQMMTGAQASAAVDEILKDAGGSLDDLRAVWAAPEASLGPFNALPSGVRQGLSTAALFWFKEAFSLTAPELERTVHGSRARAGYRLIKLAWIIHHSLKIRIGVPLLRLGRRLVRSARDRGRRRLQAILYTDHYRMPLAYALWTRCGADVQQLVQDYIEAIPVDRRICPIWRDQANRSVSCLLIGVDTILHEGRICFVESNMNPGFHADRLPVYPGGDPVLRSLVDYAGEIGCTRIVFCPSNVTAKRFKMTDLMQIELEMAWRAQAAEAGLELEVIDPPLLGSPYRRTASMFMREDARDTLFVNVRDLHNPLSRLLGTKGELDTRLESWNRDKPEAERIIIPRRILRDSDLPSPDREPRYPNIIVKDAHQDATVGIELYRCDSLPEGVNAGSRQAYEFVVPDRVRRTIDGEEEEFVCIYRTHILLTPEGSRYLATRKDISTVPVPASLDKGPVRNRQGYITNLHLSARTEPATEEAIQAHRRFSIAVNDCVAEVLRGKFAPLQ